MVVSPGLVHDTGRTKVQPKLSLNRGGYPYSPFNQRIDHAPIQGDSFYSLSNIEEIPNFLIEVTSTSPFIKAEALSFHGSLFPPHLIVQSMLPFTEPYYYDKAYLFSWLGFSGGCSVFLLCIRSMYTFLFVILKCYERHTSRFHNEESIACNF